jgi:hypothetical protein
VSEWVIAAFAFLGGYAGAYTAAWWISNADVRAHKRAQNDYVWRTKHQEELQAAARVAALEFWEKRGRHHSAHRIKSQEYYIDNKEHREAYRKGFYSNP